MAPESGQVLIGGIDQRGVGPEARPIGMVFQDYALFPHLSALHNVMLAMGLTPLQAKAEIRFSLGRDTTADDIAQALAAVRTQVLPLLLEDHPITPALATPA